MWDGWTGIELLRFLQDLRNSLPDFVTSFFEIICSAVFYLGVPLIIFMVIYWSGNKKDAEFGMLSTLTASLFAFVFKETIQQPRPWEIPGSGIDPSAEKFLVNGNSYALPSMHAAFATGGYGSIILIAKQNWLKITAAILLILIVFSRMFLCLHTPLDMIFGIAIALVMIAVNWKLIELSQRDEGTYEKIAIGYIIFAIIITAAILITGKGNETERTITTGFLVGITLARYIEHKYVGYECPATSAKNKAMLFLIGFLGIAVAIGVPYIIFRLAGLTGVGLTVGGLLGALWALAGFTYLVKNRISFIGKFC